MRKLPILGQISTCIKTRPSLRLVHNCIDINVLHLKITKNLFTFRVHSSKFNMSRQVNCIMLPKFLKTIYFFQLAGFNE